MVFVTRIHMCIGVKNIHAFQLDVEGSGGLVARSILQPTGLLPRSIPKPTVPDFIPNPPLTRLGSSTAWLITSRAQMILCVCHIVKRWPAFSSSFVCRMALNLRQPSITYPENGPHGRVIPVGRSLCLRAFVATPVYFRLRHHRYSYRSDSTGSAVAALMAWYPTVNIAMSKASMPATMNGSMPISIL